MIFSFIKRLFYEKPKRYSVGYFTLSVPENLVEKVLKTLHRGSMEELPLSSTFEILVDSFSRDISEKSFIVDQMYHYESITEAYEMEYGLSLLLFQDYGINPHFLKKNKALAKDGEVTICVIFFAERLKIQKIQTRQDLQSLFKELIAKPCYNEEILSFALKFQASDDEKTDQIDAQIKELNLYATDS